MKPLTGKKSNIKDISGVSKRPDTKEGTQFSVIIEHEDFFLLLGFR
jgi:hypothetical protein